MECAVCKAKVLDFKLQKVENISAPMATCKEGGGRELCNQLFAFNAVTVDNAMQDFFDRAQGASTPIARGSANIGRADGKVVLRIDNVPWVNRSAKFTHLSC